MSWAVWITGRPGSGKSTIAREVAAALDKRGQRVMVLEANEFSGALVPGHTPSTHEFDIVHRALIHTASILTRAGVPVIIDATAHRRVWRDLAREALQPFAEVQLICGDQTSTAREQAARWNRILSVGQARPATEPEIVVEYEYSLRADLTLDTEVQHVWTAVEDVLLLVERLRRIASREPSAEEPPCESATS